VVIAAKNLSDAVKDFNEHTLKPIGRILRDFTIAMILVFGTGYLLTSMGVSRETASDIEWVVTTTALILVTILIKLDQKRDHR
jgi:hypothetical protein